MKKHILVIDDDIDLNESLSDFLEDMGYQVDSIIDPCEIDEKINDGPYDLILLDLKMPKIQGEDLIQDLKEKMNATDIIIMSGRPHIKEYLTEKGLIGFVTAIMEKPFSGDALLEQLGKL